MPSLLEIRDDVLKLLKTLPGAHCCAFIMKLHGAASKALDRLAFSQKQFHTLRVALCCYRPLFCEWLLRWFAPFHHHDPAGGSSSSGAHIIAHSFGTAVASTILQVGCPCCAQSRVHNAQSRVHNAPSRVHNAQQSCRQGVQVNAMLDAGQDFMMLHHLIVANAAPQNALP